MSYLNLGPRPSYFVVGGVNYTENLVNWSVSDASAFRTGLIVTSGEARVATRPGSNLENYDRTKFARGMSTTLYVRYPSGRSAIHPRGSLYVMSSGYDPERDELVVQLGCALAMLRLIDDKDDIEGLAEILDAMPLDPIRDGDFANLSSALAAKGNMAYADSSNIIRQGAFFGGDGYGSGAASSFSAVKGVTCLSVSPLAATSELPDEIELTYQYPEGDLPDEEEEDEEPEIRVDKEETTSNYFLQYPAVTFVRGPARFSAGGGSGDFDDIAFDDFDNIPPLEIPDNGCGNSPKPPKVRVRPSGGGLFSLKPGGSSAGLGSYGYVNQDVIQNAPPPASITGSILANAKICTGTFQTKQEPQYVAATRREVRVTTYGGPSGQTSSTLSEIYGPALEANNQYYADKYAFCQGQFGQSCDPNGGCEFEGLDEILLGAQLTTYEYGTAAEVISTTTSTFRPTLAAAQPTDWRSGVVRGVPQQFNNDLELPSGTFNNIAEEGADPTETSVTGMYLHQVVLRNFSQDADGTNVQETETYTSTASRGTGLGLTPSTEETEDGESTVYTGSQVAQLDAYKGIKTSETRRSSTNLQGSDLRPDIISSPTTRMASGTSQILLQGGSYTSGFGPYIIKEDVPVPILLEEAEIASAVQTYGDYLRRFVMGDAKGLQITEMLTEGISSNFKPGLPFRYYDPYTGTLLSMRMDATTWSVSDAGCVFVTSGIFTAELGGSVSIPSNLLGNATPEIEAEFPADGGDELVPVYDEDGNLIGYEPPPIEVENEQIINATYNFVVEVPFTPVVNYFGSGPDGIRTPPPDSFEVAPSFMQIWWCTGFIVQPGALVTVDDEGTLPTSSLNNPVVDSTLVVNDDLFGDASSGGGDNGGGDGETPTPTPDPDPSPTPDPDPTPTPDPDPTPTPEPTPTPTPAPTPSMRLRTETVVPDPTGTIYTYRAGTSAQVDQDASGVVFCRLENSLYRMTFSDTDLNGVDIRPELDAVTPAGGPGSRLTSGKFFMKVKNRGFDLAGNNPNLWFEVTYQAIENTDFASISSRKITLELRHAEDQNQEFELVPGFDDEIDICFDVSSGTPTAAYVPSPDPGVPTFRFLRVRQSDDAQMNETPGGMNSKTLNSIFTLTFGPVDIDGKDALSAIDAAPQGGPSPLWIRYDKGSELNGWDAEKWFLVRYDSIEEVDYIVDGSLVTGWRRFKLQFTYEESDIIIVRGNTVEIALQEPNNVYTP